jgi:hypothetical protein
MKVFKWIAAGLALGLSAAVSSAAVNLVEGGKAVGRIVVPAKGSQAETLAAKQIQRYVKGMSGAELPIVQSDDAGNGPAILVGRLAANQGVIDQLNKAHPDTIDAFAVMGKGDHLSLVGRSDDSTLWAAWHWLNDEGVRFLMPGPHGTYVPKKEDVSIGEISDIEAPGIAVRGNYGFRPNDKENNPPGEAALEDGVPSWELYELRMRINRNRSFDEKDRYVFLGCGGYYTIITPQKYFKDHPDWFSMKNGKRQGDGSRPNGAGWQLCFTSHGAAEQFAENQISRMQTYLKQGIPLERILVLVTPNDGIAMCDCPDSKKLINKDGSASSLVVNFANMVASDIQKTYPNARIVFNAYSNYSTPPDHVKPGRNVCPILTAWSSYDSFGVNHAHSLFSEKNTKYRDSFAAWSKMSDALGCYEYYGHYNWFVGWPIWQQMATDMQTMSKDPKFYYMYSENHMHWGTQGLTFWLFGKLMWNPNLDLQAAIKDFCEASFGPAAKPMESYYRVLQNSMNHQGRIGGNMMEIPFVLSPGVINQCNTYVANAEKMMDRMDPDTRWRTELAVQAWHNSAKFAEAVRLFTRGKGAQDRAQVLALCDEVSRFSQTDMGKWAFEQRSTAPAIRSLTHTLSMDLEALPPGKQVFNDNLMFGGAVKFFAQVKGFRPGMWGFLLPANAKWAGTLDLPVRAQKGHQITAMRVQWKIVHPEQIAGALSYVTDQGAEKVLTTDTKQMVQGVDLPAEALGSTLRLKLHMRDANGKPGLVITGCRIDAEVK